MFWTQDYELSNGVVVSYWKLVSTYVESESKTGICKGRGYINQAAYEAGKSAVLEHDYTINFAVLDPSGNLTSAVIGLVQTAQLARIASETPVIPEPTPEEPEVPIEENTEVPVEPEA